MGRNRGISRAGSAVSPRIVRASTVCSPAPRDQGGDERSRDGKTRPPAQVAKPRLKHANLSPVTFLALGQFAAVLDWLIFGLLKHGQVEGGEGCGPLAGVGIRLRDRTGGVGVGIEPGAHVEEARAAGRRPLPARGAPQTFWAHRRRAAPAEKRSRRAPGCPPWNKFGETYPDRWSIRPEPVGRRLALAGAPAGPARAAAMVCAAPGGGAQPAGSTPETLPSGPARRRPFFFCSFASGWGFVERSAHGVA